MKIILSKRAEKQLRKLTKIDQIAVAKKIREIANQKNKVQSEKLLGYKNIFRLRLGDYRIVYAVFPEKLHIILIGQRKEVYTLLKQLLN